MVAVACIGKVIDLLVRTLVAPAPVLVHLRHLVRGLPHLLGAIVELVANAVVIFARVDHLLEAVVVTMHLNRIRNYALDAVVVAHHFH